MIPILSITSIYQQAFADLVKDAKKYIAIISLKSAIGTLLFAALYYVISPKLFFEIVTDRTYFLWNLFSFIRSHGTIGNPHILVFSLLLYLLFFLFYVGFLHFVYILKTTEKSLSVKAFFTTISPRKIMQALGAYILITLVSIAITDLIIVIVGSFILFLDRPKKFIVFALAAILPLLSVIVTEYLLAPFIIFENNEFTSDEKALSESRKRTKGHRFKIGFIFIGTLLVLAALYLMITVFITKFLPISPPAFPTFSLQSILLQSPLFKQTPMGIFLLFLLLFLFQTFHFFVIIFLLLIVGQLYKQLSRNHAKNSDV